MSQVIAGVILVCLATAPICDQDHAELMIQKRHGKACDTTDSLVSPYMKETIHYGNYQIICTSRGVADEWPNRTFKVEPLAPGTVLQNRP